MVHSGAFSAQLGPTSESFLTQTVPTVPGQSYNVSFWLAFQAGQPNDFSATFAGVTIFSVVNAPSSFPYTLHTANVTATSASSVLQFAFNSPALYWFLDDVCVTAVTASPTPTPTSTPTPSVAPTPTPTPTPATTPTPTPGACATYITSTTTGNAIVPGTVDIGNHCDDCVTGITFPFPVTLYGTTFLTANASSNGALDLTGASSAFSTSCPLPDVRFAESIFPFQSDLLTTNAGEGIFTSVTGVTPNRVFNIEWRAHYFAISGTANFEIQFFENPALSSTFAVIYGATANSGLNAESGVQQSAAGPFTQFSCNTATLTSGLKVTYSCAAAAPTPTPTPTASITPGTTPTPTPCTGTLGAWATVLNYPTVIESPAVSSNGTFAWSAGGAITGTASNGFYRYDPVANTWTTLAVLPAALYDARAVYDAATNKVYVFGGYNGTSVLATTYIYDVVAGTWSTGTVMPGPRFLPAVAYYAATGKIYVIGGVDGAFNPANQTWEYDPVANTWTTTRMNIPVAMGGSAAGIVGGFIDVAGTFGGGTGSTLHYRYDIVGDTWALKAPVPVNIYAPASGTIGSKIYVIGGGNPFSDSPLPRGTQASGQAPEVSYNSTYIYDTVSDSWAVGPNTNVAHSFTSGTAIGNRLLVVGGYNGTADTNTVEMNAVTVCPSPTPSATASPTASPSATRTPTPTPTASPSPSCAPAYRVLIAFSDGGITARSRGKSANNATGYDGSRQPDISPTTLRSQILAEPGVAACDLFDAGTGTPTLALLQTYDVVVAFSNNSYSDAVAMGDVLANYADTGGVAVAFNFDWFGAPFGLSGRWMTGGYTPFNTPAPTLFSNSTLGMFTAGHPLMQGVVTLNGFFRHTVTLAPGAIQIAAWADSVPLIAVKTQAGHTGVGINNYVGEAPNMWSGQFGRVVVNAARWLRPVACGSPTPSPTASPSATRTPTPTPTASPSPTCGPTTVNGSVTAGDPTQTGRLFRGGVASACGAPNACSTLAGTFHYHSHSFVNTSGAQACITATLTTACTGTNFIFAGAYLNTFDPANICTNNVGDPGLSPNGAPVTFGFNVPAGATFLVVVAEVTANAGCPAYTLQIAGLSCGPTPTPSASPSATVAASPSPTCMPTAWTVVAPAPTNTFYGAGTTSNGTSAYVAGGYSFEAAADLNQFRRYDLASNTWTQLAVMPDAMNNASAVYSPINNKVYVFGGGNTLAGTVSNATRIYDVATNTWSAGVPMPDVRTFMASGYFNGKIYLVGGYSTGNISPAFGQVWEYDPIANTYNTTRLVMPATLGGAGYGVINGHIYVAGGRDQTNTVVNSLYDYNIAANTWTVRANLLAADNVPGSGVTGGKLWIFGGGSPFNTPETTGNSQVYDPASNTWTAGPTLNVARSFVGGTNIGSTLFAVGGYNGSTTVSTTETASGGNCGPTPTPSPTPTATATVPPSPTPTASPTPSGTPTCPPVITQSTSQAIVAGNSAACNTGGFHADNSYWRAFNMASFVGSQQYNVTSVSFGIEACNAPTGTQPVTVRLYLETTGVFPTGTRTQIATTTVNVANQTLMVMTVPLAATIPAGTTQMIMEVNTPDEVAAMDTFFIGSNPAAQTGTSYISATACGLTVPTDVATIGFPNMHIVFNVNGGCIAGTPTPSPTATPSATRTPTPTPTPTASPSATVAASPSATVAASPSATVAASPTPTPTPPQAAQALNLSTRMKVQTGDNVGIGGFIITGNAPKNVIVRALGPTLTRFGIDPALVLADPVLELHGPAGFVTVINNNWRDTQQMAIEATGLAPTNDLESAIVATLSPGAYTGIIRGNNNTSGLGLIEVYDLNASAGSKLANISTRALVGTGNNIVIAGFILGNGTGMDRIIVRGIGPSLAPNIFPASAVLADPTLELRDTNGTLLIADNDWMDNPAQAAIITAAGLAPTNNLESAIAATLPPGLYTALLAGRVGGTGIGLVEVYDRGGGP